MGYYNPKQQTPQGASSYTPKKDGGTGIEKVPYSTIKWRLNDSVPIVERFDTGITSLNEFLGGGIPKGLTIVWGSAGSGKSLLARQIAMNIKGKALYVCCEVLTDAPSRSKYPHVDSANYTHYIPQYNKAISDLFAFIEELKPSVVVIDSLTTFLGVSKLSVPEGSVRDAVWTIHKNAEGKCPIVGISEMRGTGFNEYTAGGRGVQHGCSMLLRMDKNIIRYESQLPRFPGHKLGEIAYTIECQKDKHGLALTKPYGIGYSPEKGMYYLYEFSSSDENVCSNKNTQMKEKEGENNDKKSKTKG